MIRAPHLYSVTVRFFDADCQEIAEHKASCKGATPGEACPPAYIVAREDVKRNSPETFARIAGVAFLVHPLKQEQPTT